MKIEINHLDQLFSLHFFNQSTGAFETEVFISKGHCYFNSIHIMLFPTGRFQYIGIHVAVKFRNWLTGNKMG